MPNITTLNHAITHTYYYYHIIMKDAKTAAAAVFLTLMGLNVQAQVSHVQPPRHVCGEAISTSAL